MTTIIGIKLSNKLETVIQFQKILTKFNCYIKTRLGLNNFNSGDSCKEYGIILLEITNDSQILAIEKELIEIDNIEIQKMFFQ